MSQFRGFRATIVGTTVYATWEFTIGTVTGGSFAADDTVTWNGATGTGKVLSVVGSQMKIYRTSGVFPAVLDTVTTGTVSAQITAMSTVDAQERDINPPNFLTSTAQGAVSANDLFMVNLGALARSPRSVATIPAEDQLTIDATLSGTYKDAGCVITRDFTTNHLLPLPGAGDARVGTLMYEALTLLDAVVDTVGAWKNVADDSVSGFEANWGNSGAFTVQWRTEGDRVWLIGKAEKTTVAMSVPDEIFRLPAGDRPNQQAEYITIEGHVVTFTTSGNVTVTTDGGGTDVVTLEGFSLPLT